MVRLDVCVCVCRSVQSEKVTEMVNLKFKFNWIFAASDIELSRIEKE